MDLDGNITVGKRLGEKLQMVLDRIRHRLDSIEVAEIEEAIQGLKHAVQDAKDEAPEDLLKKIQGV